MAITKKNKSLNDELLSFINENIDAFEFNYQSKFLKVFIEDKNNWSQQIIDIVFPDYFDGYHKILVDYEIEFFKKYRVPADYDDLKEITNDKEKDELLKEHIYGLIDKIKALEIEHQKKESVKERAYNYFKSQKIKNTLIELAVDWKKNTFDSMKVKIEDALKAGEAKDSGDDYFLDLEKRFKKDSRVPIPILKGFDEMIGGGAAGGELIVVMAPTGGGKSMALVRMAVEALLNRKKVVYFTLELSKDVVGIRFDACLNGIPLKNVLKFKDVIKENAEELHNRGGRLKIEHYADGMANINTLYSYLDLLRSNENFIPDIVIVDYADNMKPLKSYGDLRHELVSIYRDLRALAFEYNIPVLTASQTNGTGYEKSGDELGLGMMAESKAKANICDLIIGIGRNPDQLRSRMATLKILKNRNGDTGGSCDLIFDTSIVKIEMVTTQENRTEIKRPFTNVDSAERKAKETANINSLMNNSVTVVLGNQEFTKEMSD